MSLWRQLLRAFDMLDARDRPQFSKLVIVYIAGVATLQGKLGATLAIALLAAAFGRSMFTAFLNRSNFSASVSDVTVETIQKRRDPTDGIEPTP